jgi:hypothetical protein
MSLLHDHAPHWARGSSSYGGSATGTDHESLIARGVSPRALVVARNLVIDAVTAEAVQALEHAGIDSILLKGPAVTRWLYGGDDPAPYTDTDLLINPGDWNAAAAVLSALDFTAPVEPLPLDRPWESLTWQRERDQASLDLHRTLVGIQASPEKAWAELSARACVMRVGGASIRALDLPARALHVALHAAQHGPQMPKPLEDLHRAVADVNPDVWHEAAALARRLEATSALSDGLRLSSSGEALAQELALPRARSIESALRSQSRLTPTVGFALGVEWFFRLPGWRRKLAWAGREIAPSTDFMRDWSRLARRGRLGMVAAYLWRPLWLSLRIGPALWAWAKAHRRVSRVH